MPHKVQVYRGWPIAANLDQDMQDGFVDVSVYPMQTEVNVTRYMETYDPFPVPAPTLTLTATTTTLTVGGTVTTPQNVAALVNGFGYSYGVQQNDTLTSIATALAALINVNTACTSSGPVITIPTAHAVTPRIGVIGQAIQEISRQRRNVVMSIWSPTPDLRDSAAKLFDPVLKARNFILMPDGTQCRIIYVGSPVTDRSEKQLCYRRDLVYSCEYGTTITISAPTVTVEQINISGGLDPTDPPIETIYL